MPTLQRNISRNKTSCYQNLSYMQINTSNFTVLFVNYPLPLLYEIRRYKETNRSRIRGF
jgi:hypothetical protein